MVPNGARNLIFLSRSCAANNVKAQELISILEQSGVKVAVKECDVGDATQLAAAVEESQRIMPHIHGVIHCGMVPKVIKAHNIR
jgi:enoyl-[acyl-carrier-protein] reductase (NADH)